MNLNTRLRGKYRRQSAMYLAGFGDIAGKGKKRKATKSGNAGPHGGKRNKASEKERALQHARHVPMVMDASGGKRRFRREEVA